MKREAEVGEKRRWYLAGLENGGRGHKPRNVDGLQKLERARSLQNECSPANTV